MTLVEAAVESLDAALSAERAGVDRIELCVDLDVGGVTAPAELIRDVIDKLRIPVFVLVRPRAGTFVYSSVEIALMVRSIESAVRSGARGIVTGALTPDGGLDVAHTEGLLKAARELPMTFHRAFDAILEPSDALEQLVELGVSRVLTSGGATTATEGAAAISRLKGEARERIVVVAGGGIREENVREVIERTGVSEVHGRFTDESRMRRLVGIAHRSPPRDA